VATVAGAALAALLQTCAPNVSPSTMAAIVTVESAGSVFAIGDNTTHRSYAPRSYQEALGTAKTLIAQGHSVDLGLGQVNSANLTGYHTTAAAMLMPPGCQNLIIASAILSGAYRWAAATYPDPRRALFGAISAYNSGSLYAGAHYVSLVVAAAQQTPLVPSIELLAGQSPASTRPAAPRPDVRPKPRPAPTPDFAFSVDVPRITR
jgi:type IV secretion system protein VirB1